MLKLKVETISKETIKPSSPTPPHLRSVQLSQLDHIAPQIYTNFLLFYSANPPELPTRLKTSLSETLVHFSPLAGRVEGSEADGTLHINCTDEGVDFIEARAEVNLESLLLHPPIDRFAELVPIKASEFRFGDPLLAVQLTALEGQAAVIGISISHQIADGASMAMFLHHWATTARGPPDYSLPPPRFDSASVFPPRPPVAVDSTPERPSCDCEGGREEAEVVTKRFVVDRRAIARLRADGSYDRARPPTRVQAVSALVWRCIVRARREPATATSTTAHVVDLRRKMSPSLSLESFGNLWVNVVASGGDGGPQQGLLEAAIRGAVESVDEVFVRRTIDGDKKRSGRERVNDCWIFSSWCRMPLYRSDFGWGEPEWVGCGVRDMRDVCILMDTRDGDGVEVWLWMARNEMERLERDPDFVAFISSQRIDRCSETRPGHRPGLMAGAG